MLRFPLWGFMRRVWTCSTGLGRLRVELSARFNTERPVLMLPKAIITCRSDWSAGFASARVSIWPSVTVAGHGPVIEVQRDLYF